MLPSQLSVTEGSGARGPSPWLLSRAWSHSRAAEASFGVGAHGRVWTQARQMFEGEVASLEALRSTGLVRAPRPIKVIDLPTGGAAFVMEYLRMRSLNR